MQALDLPNLHDAPFRMGISPGDAVEHGPWRKARDEILLRLADGPAHVALLGAAGSGKTLLLHAIARALQDQGRAVRVADRDRLPPSLAVDAVLLMDDAERLDADALARVAARKGACVLAGPLSLAGSLPAPFKTVTLSLLSADEITRFVAARLTAAGQRSDLLHPDAVLALARLSGGAPRQINALAGAAVFLASLDGAAEVSPRHVEEAAALRDGEALPEIPPPPAQSVSTEENAPEPSPAPPAAPPAPPPPASSAAPPPPPEPVLARTSSRAYRPQWDAIAVGVAVGLVLLAGAVLVYQPGKTTSQPPVTTVASTAAQPRPSPPPAQSRQETALIKSPAAVTAAQPPPPGDASSGPVAREVPMPAPHDPVTSPAAPRKPPLKLEPGADTPRIVLHYRDGAAGAAERVAAALSGTDPKFSHVEVRAVPSTPRTPTIRFFHREDVGAAWELAGALSAMGDAWQVRNYTSFQPKPRRGTLEVWLP